MAQDTGYIRIQDILGIGTGYIAMNNNVKIAQVQSLKNSGTHEIVK